VLSRNGGDVFHILLFHENQLFQRLFKGFVRPLRFREGRHNAPRGISSIHLRSTSAIPGGFQLRHRVVDILVGILLGSGWWWRWSFGDLNSPRVPCSVRTEGTKILLRRSKKVRE